MRTSTRRGAVAGVVTALVAVGGIASTGFAAAASTPPPPYFAGWVALSTGSTNTVTWSGNSSSIQTLTSDQSCALTSTGADLLRFTSEPASPGVGLNSGAIGVRENVNSNGTSCSAVDSANSEALTLALGGGVDSGLAAISASLDIDLKQNAEITATASLDGAPSGTFTLQSGSTINPADANNPTVQQCNNPADSGPDAKTGNNCRWTINAAFDTLTLTADVGSFSLMGGADGVVGGLPGYLIDMGVPAGASVLELAERTQLVKCNQSTPQISGGDVKGSSWKNLGADGCVPYPYYASVESSDGRPAVHFQKPSWARGTAEWTTTFAYSGKVPTLEFAFDSATLTFFAPAPCTYDTNGAVVTHPDADGNYACILATVVDKKAKTAQFQVYVLGDAWGRV